MRKRTGRHTEGEVMRRFAALTGRRDASEAAIIKALVAAGATVEPIPTGRGFPDLVVGFHGDNFLLEVKIKTGTLNAKQIDWHKTWAGSACVVRTPCEALRAIGADLDTVCRCAGL